MSATQNPTTNANGVNSSNGSGSPTLENAPNRDAKMARQRNVRVIDEEKAMGHDGEGSHTQVRSPGTESQKRRRLHDLAEHLHFEENAEELQKFWDQFTRKGKRQIGVKESLHALVFSSCAFPLLSYLTLQA